MEASGCFAGKVALWFESEGRRQVSDPVRLRQMNMTVALAASRWNELEGEDGGVKRMLAWLAEVERRALVRGATARVDAVRLARSWLEECGS